MNCYDLTSPIYQALEIAVGYLVAAGHTGVDANHKSIKHIVELFNRGERRPLMLANRAIDASARNKPSANLKTCRWKRGFGSIASI